MENRAQGALEYLLLIAGAVLVAAVVLSILASIAGGGKNTAETGNKKAANYLNQLENL